MPNEIVKPKPTLSSLFNIFDPYPWAPEFLRNFVGGDEKKQIWAGKMQQSVNLAALLFALGYGSRKMLRGMAPETQAALDAIDKYVPSGDGSPVDNSRLKDKPLTHAQKKAAKQKLVADATVTDPSIKQADDINNLAYALPPAAAIMAWMVGQKMAENEVRGTDLSDSKARLAKARYDYNRVLAKKLDPTVELPEKVIKKRPQNPIDWTIEKSIALKNKLFGPKEEAVKQAKDEKYTRVYPNNEVPSEPWAGYVKDLFDKFPALTGLDKYATAFSLLALLGAGKYAWNNNRARDRNIQKALDTEAALKQHALEVNDQRLDISALTGKPDESKLNTYPGALGFQD